MERLSQLWGDAPKEQNYSNCVIYSECGGGALPARRSFHDTVNRMQQSFSSLR
jgi:hypothetical protein